MPNTKILVNFKTQKVIHTEEHGGSDIYQSLIKEGYVKVGTMKVVLNKAASIHDSRVFEIGFYWENDYFDPKAKYKS